MDPAVPAMEEQESALFHSKSCQQKSKTSGFLMMVLKVVTSVVRLQGPDGGFKLSIVTTRHTESLYDPD